MIQLTITYNPQTDDCNVNGIPVAQMPTGERALKGHCYAALECARDAIRDFEPATKPSIIAAPGRLPPINGSKPG